MPEAQERSFAIITSRGNVNIGPDEVTQMSGNPRAGKSLIGLIVAG
jgi:hypothetical protein